jgi:hypothetical protein
MPSLTIYIDDRALMILERESQVRGRSVEDLAAAAVEEAAIRSVPPQAREALNEYKPRRGHG